MIFTGHAEVTIDAKLRLAIPAKFRNQVDANRDGNGWYCVPWPDGHVRLFTAKGFEEMADLGSNKLIQNGLRTELQSTLFSVAEQITPDSAGRITLPKTHLEWTGLGREVVATGAGSWIEIHDRERWQGSLAERFKKLPDLINRLAATDRPASE